MNVKPTEIEELRNLILKGEAKDPLIFLEAVMNGQDPRKLSDLYLLVSEIQAFSDGDISKEDWYEVLDMVNSRYRYRDVSLAESVAASKTLAEYLHAKRKQVEVTDGNSKGSDPSAHPLTEEEIELFKEKFNDEF